MPGNDSNQSVGRGAAVGLRGIYEGVALSLGRCCHCVCPRRDGIVLDTVPRGYSVKRRDAVILLLLHVLYMYMVSIIGDVYNDGEMTGESSFQTTHVRLFHAC